MQDVRGWWTGMTQRDGMGRQVGGVFRMGNTCTPVVDSCQCIAKPIQYCKVISLQLKYTYIKKIKLTKEKFYTNSNQQMVENTLCPCHYSIPKWKWWRVVLTFQNNDPRCQTSKAACIAVQGLLVACPFHLLVPSAAIPAKYLGPHLPLFLRLLCLNLKSKGKNSFKCPGLNSVGLIFFLFFYIG